MPDSSQLSQHDLMPEGAVGVVASSSTGYVKQLLELYGEGTPVVGLRGPDDRDRIEAASAHRVLDVEAGGGWLRDLPYTGSDSEKIAQISFTSGTTGVPKGVLLSHRALANTAQRLVDIMGLTDAVREYVGVPVYHSFGFGRCRSVLSAGGAAFVPERGFDVVELASMLSAGEVNAISAVPTLWRIVLSHRDRFESVGDRVRWIEIGSQSMSVEEKKALRGLFPESVIVQHYGLTEASRSTFLPIHAADDDALASVGRPDAPVEVALDESGRIRIRGPHLASGFLIDGQVSPITDETGWLTTNDEGRVDDAGFLHFIGRADELINCGGVKLVPEIIDDRIATGVGVDDGARVVRVPDALRGDGVLVAYRPDLVPLERVQAVAADVLAGEGVSAGSALLFRATDTFPVTDTGKLKRRELAALASEPDPTAGVPDDEGGYDPPRDPVETFVAEAISRIFESTGVGLGFSILDGGADSLRAVEVVAAIDDEFAVELSLADLHRAPTVRGIADSIRWKQAGTSPTGTKYVVPLAVGGDEALPSLFIVGGSYGNVLHLADLASGLQGAANVYGIQYRGLLDDDEPRETFQEAAKDFLEEALEVPTAGGIALAGYSGGGLIAVEMARQLIESGLKVEFLGLLDTRLPARPPYQSPFSLIEELQIRMLDSREAGRGPLDLAVRAVGKATRMLGRLVGRKEPSRFEVDEAALAELSPTKRRSEQIHVAFVRACAQYEVPRLPLRIHYFTPADQVTYPLSGGAFDYVDGVPQRVDGAANGWEEFCDAVEVIGSPGGHYDFAHAEHAEVLAARLREVLTGRAG